MAIRIIRVIRVIGTIRVIRIIMGRNLQTFKNFFLTVSLTGVLWSDYYIIPALKEGY
jgi:hypothetical protein